MTEIKQCQCGLLSTEASDPIYCDVCKTFTHWVYGLKPRSIYLSPEDYAKFKETCDQPPAPNAALRKLMTDD